MKQLTQTSADLRALADRLKGEAVFGFDTEDTVSDEDHAANPDAVFNWDCTLMCGFSLGFKNGDSTYVPLTHDSGKNAPWDEALALLRDVMEDETKTIWAHNWKFDLIPMLNNGIEPTCVMRCTSVLGWLLNKRVHRGKGGATLKIFAKTYLDHPMTDILDLMPKGSRFHEVELREAAKYAGDDALQALRLGLKWSEELEEQEMTAVFERIEMPTVRVLRHMNDVGFALDRTYLNGLADAWQEECDSLAKEFAVLTGGVSITGNIQISKFMYNEAEWWPHTDFKEGKAGNYSVDGGHRDRVREMLKRAQKPNEKGIKALDLKDRHAQIFKLLTTYTHSLIRAGDQWKDDRPRSSMQQEITVTGRFSSSNPNFQNIPVRTEEGAKIRKAFIAMPGWKLVVADYSQVELRIMAHLSQDEMLIKAYMEGIDVHQQTADETGTDRPGGKITNLGLIYEMGVGTLQNNLGCSDLKAERVHSAWHQTYNGVGRYHTRQHAFAAKHGYVKTITGRRIPIEHDWITGDHWGRKMFAQRNSSNYPCQGSCADIMKLAMKNLLKWCMEENVLFDPRTGYGSVKLVNTVHDELISEVRDDFVDTLAVKKKHIMENCVTLCVPLIAEPSVGMDWMEAK